MELWEVTNSAAGTGKSSAQSPYKIPLNRATTSLYSKILAEKISNVKADVQQMEEVREQLNEIRDLQEELTSKAKVDEDSGNANRDYFSQMVCVEKVKRFLPDGSILITTYEDGKITDQFKKKPHMVETLDYNAPPKADGSPDTKLEPSRNLDLEELLMM